MEELRERFRIALRNSGITASKEDWMKAVKVYATRFGDNPTPEQWVEAAEKAVVKCDRCTAGIYYWGASVNGKMTHSGPCFRCQGKGVQNQEDFKRNWGHTMNMRVI